MISSIQTKINNRVYPAVKSSPLFKARHSNMLDSYIAKSQLKTLFPDGIENTVIQQGNIPDCQLLSFIDGLINNKKGSKILEKMFKISPDGKTIDVFFPAHPNEPINLDFKKIKYINDIKKKRHWGFREFFTGLKEYLKTGNKENIENKTGYSPLGIEVIENAYAKYYNPKVYEKSGLYGVIYDKNYHYDSSICMKDIIGGQVDVICVEGISPKDGSHNIPLSSIKHEDKNKLFKYLEQVSKDPDSYIVTAATIRCKKRKFTKKFVQFHDYSIRKVDYENKKLTIANPWKTSLTKTITFDEFMNNFDSISFLKI